MTIAEWLHEAEGRLQASGVESHRLEAQVLAGHILLVDRSRLLAHPEEDFPDLAGENLLQRRERHEPLAYIVGKREFYGREFIVRPGVLIPRQDTETLVEAGLATIDELGQETGQVRVLDVGVGSGIIAITLKLERRAATVTGVDISEQALEIAKQNALALGADVRLLYSDCLRQLSGETFDLIVSNPPYIGESEKLSEEVSEYEPAAALFSGPTGLEFYGRLAHEAKGCLSAGGRLIVEVGHTQAAKVRELFEESGWNHVATVRDLSGVKRVVEFGH